MRTSVPRFGKSNSVHFFASGSYLPIWSVVHIGTQTLWWLSTLAEYGCSVVGFGSGTKLASPVRLSIRVRLPPQEFATHNTPAPRSIPMRRGPCDHGNGVPMSFGA